MRIGINLLAFLPNVSGGAELYALNLLKALAKTDQDNDYYLITNKDNRHYYKIESSRFHYVQQDVRARPQIKRVMWEQALLPVIARRLRLDVLHSPSYTWPILCTVRGVVTIHDMLYKDYPEWIGEPKLTFWRLFVPLSAWRCKKIFTVSDASKQAIAKYLNVPLDKIIVVPGSLDTDFSTLVDSEMEIGQTCHKYNIRRPYLLNVGGLAPHKNAASLVKALRGLHERPETRDLTLVITGNDNGAKQAISSLTSSLNLNDHISLPGYVEKKDLPAIYAGALAYVAPSYYEGFGLTLLEAMSQGTPVITSDRYSLPEVAGDAAIIVQPDDVEHIEKAIRLIASDPQERTRMATRGFERVKDYSWEMTAKATILAYRTIYHEL